MAVVVYVLCALTSVACAVMLFRGYVQNRARFLLWSSLCFVCLALNNILLFINLVIIPTVDLSMWRSLSALAGVALLLYGLVWDAR